MDRIIFVVFLSITVAISDAEKPVPQAYFLPPAPNDGDHLDSTNNAVSSGEMLPTRGLRGSRFPELNAPPSSSPYTGGASVYPGFYAVPTELSFVRDPRSTLPPATSSSMLEPSRV